MKKELGLRAKLNSCQEFERDKRLCFKLSKSLDSSRDFQCFFTKDTKSNPKLQNNTQSLKYIEIPNPEKLFPNPTTK